MVVGLTLAAGYWFGRSAYRRHKERGSLTQARAFLAKGDYANASVAARQALARNTNNLEACQLMADLADLNGSPVALDWRRRIAVLAPTLDNQILAAACALRFENPPFPIAAQALETMGPVAQTNIAYQLAAADLALKLNRRAAAEAHMQAAATLEPTNLLHQLNLARLRLRTRDPNTVTAARRELATLAADPVLGEFALRALRTDALEQKDFAVAQNYSSRLLALPQASFDDQLQHLSLLQLAADAQLRPALDQLQRQSATNAPAIYRTTAWMLSHGFRTEALLWLQGLPEAVRSQPPVPLALTESYVANESWPALETFLEPQQWHEMDFLRFAFRSRAAQQQNLPQAAESHWHSAIAQAGDRFGALTALRQLASRWERPQDESDLLWRIVGRFPGQRWALRELEHNYRVAGNTGGLNKVYIALLALAPTDAGLKNNVAATSLLLRLNQTQAYGLAREVYEAAKTNAVFVSTYAFALHRQDKSGEGLKLMEALPATALQRPEIATYYAVLLSAAGNRDKAGAYFTAAEAGQLLPEERQLLAQARGKH